MCLCHFVQAESNSEWNQLTFLTDDKNILNSIRARIPWLLFLQEWPGHPKQDRWVSICKRNMGRKARWLCYHYYHKASPNEGSYLSSVDFKFYLFHWCSLDISGVTFLPNHPIIISKTKIKLKSRCIRSGNMTLFSVHKKRDEYMLKVIQPLNGRK